MSISPEQFLSLPREIQTEIISQDPAAIQSFSLANKKYQEQLNRSYLKTICDKPITLQEIDTYLAQIPLIVGNLYVNNPRNIRTVGIDIHINRVGSSNYDVQQTFADLDENFDIDDDNLYAPAVNNEGNILTALDRPRDGNNIDLLAKYYIYRNRLSCIKRDPKFAKNKVVQILDDVYNSYDKTNPSSKLFTAFFLFVNGTVLNVFPGLDVISIVNYRAFEEELEDEIERVYKELRAKLLNL